MWKVIFGLSVLVLAGCASFSELRSEMYEQGGTSDNIFDRDSADCEMKGAENQSVGGMGGLAGVASYYETYNRVYDACMRSKGYPRTAENPMK